MALGDVDQKRVAEIRDEVRRLGVEELLTEEAVIAAELDKGMAFVFVNTDDGCADELARPALAYALQHDPLPERLYSVFAGQELEATAKARSYFKGYFPTAPQMALLIDGEVVYMCDRDDIIKMRKVEKVADNITAAFDQYLSEGAESDAEADAEAGGDS